MPHRSRSTANTLEPYWMPFTAYRRDRGPSPMSPLRARGRRRDGGDRTPAVAIRGGPHGAKDRHAMARCARNSARVLPTRSLRGLAAVLLVSGGALGGCGTDDLRRPPIEAPGPVGGYSGPRGPATATSGPITDYCGRFGMPGSAATRDSSACGPGAPPPSATPMPLPAPQTPSLTYAYDNDAQKVTAEADAMRYCRSRGAAAASEVTNLPNAAGGGTVTFTCGR